MITLEIKDVESLLDRLDTLTEEIRHMSAHHRVIVSTIQEHGAVIERLVAAHERLRFHCPLFEMIESKQMKAGNGDTDVRESSPHICVLEDTNKD